MHYYVYMNDSLDDFTLLVGVLPGDEAWGDYPNDSRKPFQATQLLLLNEDFITDIAKLRSKYSVGQYALEGDRFNEEELYPEESLLDSFHTDIRRVSNGIKFPGTWDEAVKRFVIGYDPDIVLVPSERRQAIVAKNNDDYVEVRIYGVVDAKSIKKVAAQIAGMSKDGSSSQDRESTVKYRPELEKSLSILRLKKAGYTYSQIAESLSYKQNGIEAEDVSAYLRNLKKQVEKIYIKID